MEGPLYPQENAMTRPCRPAAAILALAALAAAAPAGAQDLTYTTTTKMEMSGAMGRMLSMFTDMDKPMAEKTSYQGSRVRKDQDQSSSIMDWGTGALTLLDHKERTFTRVDFAQMTAQAAEAMQAERPRAQGPEMEVNVRTDRTGKTETIAGYKADQVVLVIEMKPKGAEGDQAAQPTTALVTDMWLSTDFPEYQMMQHMAGDVAERMRESAAQGVTQAMGALAGSDPAMKEGWEKNLEAMKELQGTALRTTTHFVTVPPGAELDVQKVLDSAGEKVQEGGGVAQGAGNAAKQALGGLAGRFGRGRQQQQEQAQAAPTQMVIMRVKSEISDVGTGAVDPSVFEVPAGYKEKAPPGKD